jgi:hypothetical protein
MVLACLKTLPEIFLQATNKHIKPVAMAFCLESKFELGTLPAESGHMTLYDFTNITCNVPRTMTNIYVF